MSTYKKRHLLSVLIIFLSIVCVKNSFAQVFWLGINDNIKNKTDKYFAPFLIKINTNSAQINVLNRENETFSSKISTIALDDAGTGYVITEGGNIYKYRKMHRALVRHHYPFKVNTLAMSDSYIWLGTESGLIRCEHGDDDFSDCRIIDSGIRNTTSLLLDDDGSGLILTSNGQLHRYEKGNFAETPQTFTGYPKILQSDAVHQKSLVIMCSDSQCTQKRQYSCSLDGHQCEESTTGVFTVGDL